MQGWALKQVSAHTRIYRGIKWRHRQGRNCEWCTSANGGYKAGIQFKTDIDYTAYINKEVQENSSFIAEETERYKKLLDMATERFNSELTDIEKRCYDPTQIRKNS